MTKQIISKEIYKINVFFWFKASQKKSKKFFDSNTVNFHEVKTLDHFIKISRNNYVVRVPRNILNDYIYLDSKLEIFLFQTTAEI